MIKQIGAVLLVAGTCIGSGMIALPMVLAKLGVIPSVLLMAVVWFIMYYTSLIHLELNLQVGHGVALGELGRIFSGRGAEWVGLISLKLLSYSLLAVFIYGEASILQEVIESKWGISYSFDTIAAIFSLIIILLLLLPIQFIDYFNRLLFVGLIAVVGVLLAGLAVSIDWGHMPLFSPRMDISSVWVALLPVVFTSFGFQVIFHTLSNYCRMDPKMLKRAFFWGSLIPAVVYTIWTTAILSIVYQNDFGFYEQMIYGNAEVGELIRVLSDIAQSESIRHLVWGISLLAIATSVLGVGVGLFDSLKKSVVKKIPQNLFSTLLAAFLTIFPAYLVVVLIPNAFIAVLGFAGMILAVIAVLLPAYLFFRVGTRNLYYPELNNHMLIFISVGVALAVIVCEALNML